MNKNNILSDLSAANIETIRFEHARGNDWHVFIVDFASTPNPSTHLLGSDKEESDANVWRDIFIKCTPISNDQEFFVMATQDVFREDLS